jgi:hypothetical protein
VFGEGGTFDGGAFLGIDGLVGGGPRGHPVGDEAGDGGGVRVEGVLADILGGAGFVCRSAWSGDLRALARLAATRSGEVGIDQALACRWGAEVGGGSRRLGAMGRFREDSCYR